MGLILAVNSSALFGFDNEVVNQLNRFQTHTVETVLKVRSEGLLTLAYPRPYLIHSILALSAMHDRYLRSSVPESPSTFETYHFTRGVALLNQRLSQNPLPIEDWDALWLTATFLGTLSVGSVYSVAPNEAWPLKSPDWTEPEWLRMTQGKHAIWELTQPLRPESFLQTMKEEYVQMLTEDTSVKVNSAPRVLLKLCKITTASPENNPYYTALKTLLRLLNPHSGIFSRADFLAFTGQMTSSFKDLLRKKDPVALLLLALWYEKAGQAVWWIRVRATVESRSICQYLRFYHGDHRVIKLLVLPE